MQANANKTADAPARYGPAGRDPAERPANAKPWLETEAMPAAWATLYANADPSGLEADDIEAAERAEARYAAEGYTFSGTAYGPHDSIENTDAEGNPLDVHEFDGAWKASDFDDDENEERWGRECALEVFATLYLEGWTPVRRLGNGYVERNETFHGHEGPLTPYLMRYKRERKQVPPIEQDD